MGWRLDILGLQTVTVSGRGLQTMNALRIDGRDSYSRIGLYQGIVDCDDELGVRHEGFADDDGDQDGGFELLTI